MSTRWTTWLAISLWTLVMILGACCVALLYANREFNLQSLTGSTLPLLAAASQSTVGVMLALHRPRNPIGWIFLAAALSFLMLGVADRYAYYITVTAPGALPEITLLFWFGSWVWIISHFVTSSFGILLFPTGRLPSRRWRPFAWLVAGWLALWTLAEMLSPELLDPQGEYPHFSNPIGLTSMTGTIDVILAIAEGAAIFMLLGTAYSIFVRMRAVTATERQQIKWFAFAATIPVAGFAAYLTLQALPHVSFDSANEVGEVTITVGTVVLPAAIGIAILRHNLYDIDRLINRTLVYAGVTALLGLGFVTSIISFQLMLSSFTRGSDLAIAGSTLLTASLFRPIRNRLQLLVDRHFYRQRYDAQRMLESFTVVAQDAVDLDQLANQMVEVITTTMQPRSVSIWLRGIERAERHR